MRIGAHVPNDYPLAHAQKVEAECLQIFLGSPQSWKRPPPRDDVEELRAASVPIYVHAPYLINVASPNNRIRIPSRKILKQTVECAEEIGATGVMVHGGHAEDGVARGLIRWRKVFEEHDSDMPVIIENTAGGSNAMTRYVDNIARLWDALSDFDVQFCFDTCHAHAAGEDVRDVVDRVLKVVGRIDVVHANDSRDAPGSGADRHANFKLGQIDDEVVVDMVRAAGAPIVLCENPWEGVGDDLAWLRARLAPQSGP